MPSGALPALFAALTFFTEGFSERLGSQPCRYFAGGLLGRTLGRLLRDALLMRSTWDAVGMINTSPISASDWLLMAAMLLTGILYRASNRLQCVSRADTVYSP